MKNNSSIIGSMEEIDWKTRARAAMEAGKVATREAVAIPEKTKKDAGEFVAGMFGLAMLAAIVAGLWFWLAPDSLQLTTKYNLPDSAVYVQPKPHNCDFDWAPIGNKGCRYVKHTMLLDAHDNEVQPPTQPTSVLVTWELERN
jgi:hypothetical protein